MKYNLKTTITFLLQVVAIAATAQKLPNVQPTSVRAPAMKLDGKAIEWDNLFKAYNNATNVYYTLCNDDKNLYLTVQATDQSVITKILRGGMTFTVNTSGKKNEKTGASITFPIFGTDRPKINLRGAPEVIPGNAASIQKADSFMYANNRLLNEKSKNIITRGLKGVDTIISVYNEDGIKCVEAFNNKMVYTCEIAIDLKKLDLSIDNPQMFAYNFKLNGVNIDDLLKNMTVVTSPDGATHTMTLNTGATAGAVTISNTTSFSAGGGGDGAPVTVVSGRGSGAQVLTSPTDFWGEYTLAKN